MGFHGDLFQEYFVPDMVNASVLDGQLRNKCDDTSIQVAEADIFLLGWSGLHWEISTR